MHRTVPIGHLLYAHLFPHPTPADPQSFSAHLARNLVPEVRIEVSIFYGDLNSVEARYPGLNYCYPAHRMRLGRFKHHRRLFDAFDALGLTYREIQDFCCWEGTKWARERYEKDEGVKVVDTTGDDIPRYVDRRASAQAGLDAELLATRRSSITRKTDIEVIVEEAEPANTLINRRREMRPHRRRLYGMRGNIQEDEVPASNWDVDEEMEGDDLASQSPRSRFPSRSHHDSTSAPIPSMTARRASHHAILAHARRSAAARAMSNATEDGNMDLDAPVSSHSGPSFPSFLPAPDSHRINQRILAAWEQGLSLPPEIEQYIKEQSEQTGSLTGLASLIERRRTGSVQQTQARRESATTTRSRAQQTNEQAPTSVPTLGPHVESAMA